MGQNLSVFRSLSLTAFSNVTMIMLRKRYLEVLMQFLEKLGDMPADVIVHMLQAKCLPSLMYGLDA